MSDDLKSRLRKFEGGDKYGSTVWYRNPDGPEAADRIEQLEAALREIAENNSVQAGLDKDMYRRWRRVATDAIDVARAALGEKKDD